MEKLPLALEYNNPFMLKQYNYEGIIGRDYSFYRFAACRYGLRSAALTILRLYFKKEKHCLAYILPCLPCFHFKVMVSDCILYLSKRLHVDAFDDIELGVSDDQLGFLRAFILNIMTFLYDEQSICSWYSFDAADYAIASAKLEMIYKYHV